MDVWAARIAAAAVFYASMLITTDVIAETLALKCSIGGQEVTAPFNIDLTNKTIDLGKGVVLAEVNRQAISWREEGVLRTIDRSTYTVFRRLPDGSFFQIGTCQPLEK
ncbi:hypothetical protein SAMN05443247_00650 [Bradyrhizobium erythrophlei]|jgi:hypothetical protein|nr:hypothetical protein SAMN05443247_00650 [Bradyrhizobium erythrophlei]